MFKLKKKINYSTYISVPLKVLTSSPLLNSMSFVMRRNRNDFMIMWLLRDAILTNNIKGLIPQWNVLKAEIFHRLCFILLVRIHQSLIITTAKLDIGHNYNKLVAAFGIKILNKLPSLIQTLISDSASSRVLHNDNIQLKRFIYFSWLQLINNFLT